jgi:hypothetical protein
VTVRPGSTKPGIHRIKDREFKVKVKSPPEKGKANKEIVERLAEYFNVSKSQIIILRGHTSRKKIIEIKGL